MELGDIKCKAAKGLAWVTLYSAMARIIQLLGMMVLAGILEPQDFGAFELANALVIGLVMLRELGFTPALVQIQDEVERAFRASTMAIPLLGLTVYALIFLLAPYYSRLVADDSLIPLVKVAGLVAPFSALGIVPAVYLQRQLQFSKKVLPELSSAILSSGLSVIIALQGGGVWSLVACTVLFELFRSLFYWIALKRIFIPTIDFKMWKRLVNFGYNVSLGSIGVFLFGLVDRLAIGKFFGKTALGFYSIAIRLNNAVSNNTIILSNQVMLATLSSLQDDKEKYFRAYYRGLTLFILIASPIYTGIFLFGGDILHSIYGSKWDGALTALKILAVYGFCRAIGEINGEVFFSQGKPKYFKYQGIGRLLLVLIALPLVIKYGRMETVALLFSGTLLLFVILTFYWSTKLMEKKLWELFPIFRTHLLGMLAGLALYLFSEKIVGSLILNMVSYYLGYGAVLFLMMKREFREVVEMVKGRRFTTD
jgi:PST family polysaccharide transporter